MMLEELFSLVNILEYCLVVCVSMIKLSTTAESLCYHYIALC